MAKNELSPMAKSLWALAITQGVLAILFGTLALFWPGLTVALLVVMFGVFILVWGIVGLIVSLSSIGSNKFWWLELIFSVLAIGLSVYMLRNPEVTAGIFVFFIGITFLVRGVISGKHKMGEIALGWTIGKTIEFLESLSYLNFLKT